MVQDEESEVDGTCIGCDEAGETWKRLQTFCLVSPTVGFGEYSQADAQVVTRETVSETSILEEIRENMMTHCEEANEEGHDDSEEAPLPPIHKRSPGYGQTTTALRNVPQKINNHLMKQLLDNKKQSTILDYFGQK